jgi:hypothetical protein
MVKIFSRPDDDGSDRREVRRFQVTDRRWG